MPLLKDVILELIKALFSLSILFVGWYVGNRIIARWDIVKKRQELDLTLSTQFQQLYGEFKEVSRLWRIYIKDQNNDNKDQTNNKKDQNNSKNRRYPDHTHWEILKSAIALESKFESMVVKLATERDLNERETKWIGLLRQAFQQLREDIRDGVPLPFTMHGPGYKLFHDLACHGAYIISSGKHSNSVTDEMARSKLREIARIGSKALVEESKKEEYQGEDYPGAEPKTISSLPE